MKSAWRTVKHHGSFFLGFFILLYLVLNIVASQWISPLYSGLVDEQKTSIVPYLRKIVSLPDYKSEFVRYEISFGKTLIDEVTQEKRAREQLLQKLDQILYLSPQSRDVLYRLFLLYKEQGDNIKAQNYFKRAKEVDPLLQ